MDKDKILQDLADFIKIQSVSTDPNRLSQILQAADFLENKLKALGFKVNKYKKDNSPPLILASRFADASLGTGKTIGIYCHYDVQPEDPVSEWKSDPFKLSLRDGKLFGRGVADDKGHIIQNIASINRLVKAKKLKNNIIFIFEGEEEEGSVNFENYVKQGKEIIEKADIFYVMDMGMFEKNVPQIYYGLRGLIYFEINISIGERDLHSGIYGNRVLNPIQVLSDLFVKVKNLNTNKINIPHFYQECRRINEKEIQLLKKVMRTNEAEKKNSGVYEIISFEDIHPSLASKIYPSFEINGIKSGFTDAGSKTIIPKSANAKFSFRLVEYQDPEKIETLVKQFIKDNLSRDVKYTLTTIAKSVPFYTSLDNTYVKKTAQVLSGYFGNQTLFNRSGGSVAASEILQRLFHKPIILTGFTLPDDNIHAPNENFDEEMFFRGIEALERIYANI